MLLNYNELLPLFLASLICALINCIDEFVVNKKKDNDGLEDKDNVNINLLSFFRNTIYNLIFSSALFYIAGGFTDNYELRIGIVIIISILGTDKALMLIEKILNLKKDGLNKGA